MDSIRLGDLVVVSSLFKGENISGVVVKGPYPAVFTIEDGTTVFSEETLAVDLISGGRLYCKIKCNLLKKINY